MITMQGSVPYPPYADAGPILTLASDLGQMASGLGQGADKLVATATTSQSSWTGAAAEAFVNQMARRSATIDQVAQTIASAATPLQTFAAAITASQAAYSSAAIAERAAQAGLPWTAGALAAAIAAEAAAVVSLETAGVACATAMAIIEARVAAAEYGLAHRQPSTPQSAPTPSTTPTPSSTTPSSTPTDTPPASAPPQTSTSEPQPERPAAETIEGEIDWSKLLEDLVGTVHTAVTGVEGVIDGYVHGLEKALEENAQQYVRNGKTLLRWAANRGGPSIGMTYGQAAESAADAAKWGRRLVPVGLVVDGVEQVMDDNHDESLTTMQRVSRTTAAVVLQGGGAIAGAEVGAEVGALVGSFFGGVGAVPGAVIGGAVGGLVGAFTGSEIGKAVKESLFNWNPMGAFK